MAIKVIICRGVLHTPILLGAWVVFCLALAPGAEAYSDFPRYVSPPSYKYYASGFAYPTYAAAYPSGGYTAVNGVYPLDFHLNRFYQKQGVPVVLTPRQQAAIAAQKPRGGRIW